MVETWPVETVSMPAAEISEAAIATMTEAIVLDMMVQNLMCLEHYILSYVHPGIFNLDQKYQT